MEPDAALVDILEFRPSPNSLGNQEFQRKLLAAYRQTLATLGAAALQDEATVFGAHPHQKSMRLRASTLIRLKRADSLSHDSPSE